jgi:predicted dehydrogenase
MMCHSVLLVRHLLTAPGASYSSLQPVRISGQIASLKWTLPEYAERLEKIMGDGVNYRVKPAEDFARVTIDFKTDDGALAIGEATTSWSFVGAGLRLSAELLGPEYSLMWNTLDSGLKLFFSREVRGQSGEDLLEKQNAEMGQMPVVANEAAAYGYEAEDRHFVRAFLRNEKPALTFEDGLQVVRILMAGYLSAEQGRTIEFPPPDLDTYIPTVAQGTWNPRRW